MTSPSHRGPRTAAVVACLALVAGCGSARSDEELEPATTTVTTAAAVEATSTTAVDGPATTAPPTTEPEPSAENCTTTETGPISIGNVGDYSGPIGATNANWPKGVELWVQSVNAAGGICGRQVELSVTDAAGDTAANASAAQTMVETEGVVAMVGNANSLSGSGSLDYLLTAAIPVVGDQGMFDPLFHTPYAVPINVISDDAVGAYNRAMMDVTGATDFGLLICAEADACHRAGDSVQRVAPQVGVDLVWYAEASVTQVDFTAECQAAEAAGAEMVFPVTDGGSIVRFAQSCTRQGYVPAWGLMAQTITDAVRQEPALASAYYLSQVFPFAGASSPEIDKFHAAIDQYAPDVDVDSALASGWTAGKLFELLAVRAATMTGTITAESIVEAMGTLSEETVGGLTIPLTMTPEGVDNGACTFIMQGDGAGGFIAPIGADLFC